jgi:hypothetical protein
MSQDTEHQFWYNMRTGLVEEGAQSLSLDRVGPFRTREEASRALDTLRENSKRWADEDAGDR